MIEDLAFFWYLILDILSRFKVYRFIRGGHWYYIKFLVNENYEQGWVRSNSNINYQSLKSIFTVIKEEVHY